jgi:peptidyl-prolyl cis-trans isomerase B (cyclophilin B)
MKKKMWLMLVAPMLMLSAGLAACGSGDGAGGKVENTGEITVKLDPSAAPVTVANFEKLANDGFYDGLTFHRIVSGFMIQGGDPDGNGTGGSDENIKGEFASNGVENPISHVRGVISMARSNDFDSASSQFFITNADSTFLDGQYAAFGTVTSGMDVVDKVSAVKVSGETPESPVTIKSIKIESDDVAVISVEW